MKYNLIRGKEIEVDVENTGGRVVLALTAARKKHHAMPSVKVSSEYSGFTSTIRSIALASTKRARAGAVVDSYEITVEWAPGADHSGSLVKVTYPDTGAVAKANLYMMF